LWLPVSKLLHEYRNSKPDEFSFVSPSFEDNLGSAANFRIADNPETNGSTMSSSERLYSG